MAERTVSVKLSAKVDPYVNAMRKASGATSDMQKGASRDFSKLGSQMQSVGTKATLGVTAPLAGIAGAAIKMSNDFDASMSKIVGLVGLGADEVEGMKESVLELAGDTARAPQELADGLFVITSAGLRGQAALDALEASAKASAAGLGETNDIARAVAGAMNAYGPDVLNAADATDILTAAARGGNFETSQLAGSLGKVLPFAKQAGASLEDVGGAVALLTRTNGNAAESITQINGLMRAFVTPTQEAKTILDEMGLSAGDVRDSIGENGLVATLEMLNGELGGNREQLGRLIGSSEGASAAFQILDADAASLEGTFGVTANAAGMVGEAFGAAADTDAFKMEQSLNDLKIAMIEVGEVLAPIAADIAGGIAKMASAFSDLDPVVQKVIIGIAGVSAVAGPLLVVVGSLIKSYATLKTAMVGLNGKTTLLKGSMLGVGAALAAAVIVYESYNRKKKEAEQRTTDFVAALEAEASGQDDALDAMLARTLATDRAREAIEDLGVSATDVARFIKGEEVPAVQALLDAQDRLGSSSESFRIIQEELGLGANANAADFKILSDIIVEQSAAHEEASAQMAAQTETAEALRESSGRMAGATHLAQLEMSDFGDSVVDADQALVDEADAVASAEDAQAALESQTEANADSMAKFSEFVDLAKASHEAMVDAVMGSLSTLFDYESAVLGLENAYADYQDQVEANIETQADGEASDRDKERSANDLRLAEIALADEAFNTAAAFAEERGAVEGSAEWADIMKTKLGEQADEYPELRGEIGLYIDELNRIPRDINIDIVAHYKATGSSTVPVDINRGGPRAYGGPTYANTIHEVGERGPELFEQAGRTFLLSSDPGFVVPLGGAGGSTSTTSPGMRPEDMARAMAWAFPSTLTLEVDGRQMSAHVKGVVRETEREKAGSM